MPVAFYMDVHVPQAISDQLRRRGVDVLTAIEETRRRGDALTRRQVEIKMPSPRLRVAVSPRRVSSRRVASGYALGRKVRDLELIAMASDLPEWANTIQYPPFKSLSA